MRMLLGLTEALPSLVEARFSSAKAAQGLVFSPTELAIIRTSAGVPFQLRHCPSLAKKPEPKKEKNSDKATKKFDPFDNPPADLLVADIPQTNPSHLLVLNKFPIISQHFILATKANKQQTHALEQDDLAASYACLKAWQEGDARDSARQLFAFFNSGEHSGASQPHRHLQFLPVESMKEDGESSGWDLLTDLILSSPKAGAMDALPSLIQHPDVPFTHFALEFPSEPTGPQILKTYNELYEAAKEAVDNFISTNPGQLSLHSTEEGGLPISYNLGMTLAGMAIIPRRKEGYMLRGDDGTDIGFVALNGTTLGGTLMVKFQEQWDVLRTQPEKLDEILAAIGIPKKTQLFNL